MSIPQNRALSPVDVIASVPADTLKIYVPDDGGEKAYLVIGPENAERIVAALERHDMLSKACCSRQSPIMQVL